jgi:uncharacterized protein (DUF4415 family)
VYILKQLQVSFHMANQESASTGRDDAAHSNTLRPLAADDEFWRRTDAYMPKTKQGVFVRLDADVLTWLKARGKGYQTRMNAMLRVLMESDNASRLLAMDRSGVAMGPIEIPAASSAEGATMVAGAFDTAPVLDLVPPTRRRRTRIVAS